jgi:hypothetical protein
MKHINAAEERLTYSVIGAFFEVYNTLGFGLSEHLCVMALEQELFERGHRVAREVGVDVWYKGRVLGHQRIDMIVDTQHHPHHPFHPNHLVQPSADLPVKVHDETSGTT